MKLWTIRRRASRTVALGLTVAFLATACDDGGGSDGGNGEIGAEEEQGPDSAAADGDCDADDPISVGALFSLTGPAADIGARSREGVEMATETINGSGGIVGRCIETHFGDDEGDPTRASQAARELVDQVGVDVLIGPFLSSPAGAAIEVSNQAQLIHIQGSTLQEAGDPSIYPYAFRVQVAAGLQAATFVQFLETAGHESVAVIAVNNDLGIGVSEAFGAAAADAGIEVLAVEFHESGDSDHTPQMQALQATDADALIVMNTAVPDIVASLRARSGIGWDAPVLGFSSMAFPEVTEAIGFDAMEGVLAGQAFANISRDASGAIVGGERIEDWLDRYRTFTGVEEIEVGPQQVASFYDAVSMYADAANTVGSLEADAIRDHLQANAYEGIMATYQNDETRHDGVTFDDLVFVVARSFENGTYEVAPEESVS